jgi:hypothetical protein
MQQFSVNSFHPENRSNLYWKLVQPITAFVLTIVWIYYGVKLSE